MEESLFFAKALTPTVRWDKLLRFLFIRKSKIALPGVFRIQKRKCLVLFYAMNTLEVSKYQALVAAHCPLCQVQLLGVGAVGLYG